MENKTPTQQISTQKVQIVNKSTRQHFYNPLTKSPDHQLKLSTKPQKPSLKRRTKEAACPQSKLHLCDLWWTDWNHKLHLKKKLIRLQSHGTAPGRTLRRWGQGRGRRQRAPHPHALSKDQHTNQFRQAPECNERGGEEEPEAVHFRPRMVVSGGTTRARRVPRSVSRKRVTGASPPSRWAAAIAGERPPLVRGGKRGQGRGHGGREAERRGVLMMRLGHAKAYFREPPSNSKPHFLEYVL